MQEQGEELIRWPSWSWEFEQYLITLDKEFQNEFQYIRKNPKAPLPVTAQTAEEADRSRIVYGLLASLLNDRLKRMLKTIPNANGFEAYRQISADLKPSSRTRALALISMSHSWPVFENKAGLLSQLLRLEQAIGEYDSIASEVEPSRISRLQWRLIVSVKKAKVKGVRAVKEKEIKGIIKAKQRTKARMAKPKESRLTTQLQTRHAIIASAKATLPEIVHSQRRCNRLKPKHLLRSPHPPKAMVETESPRLLQNRRSGASC